jgi:hypothetical protein
MSCSLGRLNGVLPQRRPPYRREPENKEPEIPVSHSWRRSTNEGGSTVTGVISLARTWDLPYVGIGTARVPAHQEERVLEEPDGRLSSGRLALCTQPTTTMRSHPRFFSQRLRSTRRRDTFPRLRYRQKTRTQSRIQDARHPHSAFCTEPHQQRGSSTTLLRDAYSPGIS